MSAPKTEVWTESVLKHLELGMNIKDSCALSNISREAYYKHIEKYPEYLDRVEEAITKCKERNIKVIQKAAEEGTWTASAWWLERKYKDEFSQRVENTGKEGRDLIPQDAVEKALESLKGKK